MKLPPMTVRAGRLSLPARQRGTGVSAAPSVGGLLAARSRREQTQRQLTHFSNESNLTTFDVTPDGKQIVFDRSRENSDIVLIDLPK